jgi:hypothetical protein
VLSNSLFEGFTCDNAFDLNGSGFLRTKSESGNQTSLQIDVDGGGDNFVTIAIIEGQPPACSPTTRRCWTSLSEQAAPPLSEQPLDDP